MEVFFIRYRKLLLFASAYMLLYFLYQVYEGIEYINSSKPGESIGVLIDACISLFVSIYLFINVHKAYKKYKEENIAVGEN